MFNLKIDANKAWVLQRETLTLYSEGYNATKIKLNLDTAWDGLSKIGVFRAYDAQIDVAVMTDIVEIPVSVLLKPNVHLLFGLYGVAADGSVVIPTVWADLGIIQAAPNPTAASNYGPPALGLYAQLQQMTQAAQAAAEAAAAGVYAGSCNFEIDENGVLNLEGAVVSFAVNNNGHLIMTTTTASGSTDTDRGPVTAYATAVAGGYEGTYAEFQQLLMTNAEVLADVEAALDAVEDAEAAAESASAAAASVVDTAAAASSAASAASTAAAAAQATANTKQAQHKTATVTLPSGASSWTNLAATGVTASNLVIYSAAPESFEDAAEALVRMTAQGAGVVSFAASATTNADITINLAIFD